MFLIGIIVLFLIIILVYSFYKNMNYNPKINNLEIIFSSNKTQINNQSPIIDSDRSYIEPYKFIIKNNSNSESKYNLIIRDIKNNNINKKKLSRNNLRYELIINGISLKINSLSAIKNNILDTRKIKANHINTYYLRIWIDSKTKSNLWVDRYYNYSINIDPIL